ncbi:MAG: AAA family ATPase [Candidatus Micrarchaeia archaeon]
MGTAVRKSLMHEKLIAILRELEHNPSLANALLVAFSCLFALLKFQFYPIWAMVPLVLLVGAIAYRYAPLGTILSLFIVLPAVAYQSPVLAWVFVLVLSIAMFKAFTAWHIISTLLIVVLAPFSPIGGVIIPLLAVSSLLLGSKKSVFLTMPSIFLIALFSALWGTGNTAFIPVKLYTPANALSVNRPPPSGINFIEEFVVSIANITSWEHMSKVGTAFSNVLGYSTELIIRDSIVVSLFFWTSAVFLISLLSGAIKRKYHNTISALSLFLILPGFFIASMISYGNIGTSTMIEAAFLVSYIVFTLAFLAVLEFRGIDISREIQVTKLEKQERFGRLAVVDLSLSPVAEKLEDIGGYEDVKRELIETIVWPLQRKELTVAYGIKPPRGILLFGPPGTGKTLIMRALAKTLDIGFYYVKCSDLLSEWYGESERNIVKLFEVARKNAPCVLFFDEIDAIGKRRDAYSADDIGPRLLSILLMELDGFKSEKDVIIIGATNIPRQIDPALMRPGRFDKIIYMPLPDKEARKSIFKVHTRQIPIADDVDFEKLAEMTDRFSGADIKNICTEAARLAAKEAISENAVVPVRMAHFTRIINSIKPSVSLSMLEDYEKFKLDFERRVGMLEEKAEEKEEKVGWKDVAGLDEVRAMLLDAIEIPLLHEDLVKEYKVKPPKGILLFGPPGCGKTLIVKAAANELKATFIYVSGAELLKKGYEGAVEVLKETFNRARENAPAVIFMDEIEALAPSREMYSSPVIDNIVGQLLTELDGVRELKNVVLIGATNKPSMLDKALLRPGRFDKIIFIPPPSEEVRKRIFAINLEGIPLERVDLRALAMETEGFTGADIAAVCHDAKLLLVKKRLREKTKDVKLTMEDFETILSKRKPSVTLEQLNEYMSFLKEYGERK